MFKKEIIKIVRIYL